MFAPGVEPLTRLLFAASAVDPPRTLTGDARAPLLAASSSRYFFTPDWLSISHGFYTDDADDTTQLPVDSSSQQRISALAANDQFVFLAGRCENNLICKIDVTTGGPVYAVDRVYRSPSSMDGATVVQLFADGNMLYWSVRTASSNSTWRCDLGAVCGDTATEIASAAAEGFSRNSTDVYFVASEQLYRIPREPIAP